MREIRQGEMGSSALINSFIQDASLAHEFGVYTVPSGGYSLFQVYQHSLCNNFDCNKMHIVLQATFYSGGCWWGWCDPSIRIDNWWLYVESTGQTMAGILWIRCTLFLNVTCCVVIVEGVRSCCCCPLSWWGWWMHISALGGYSLLLPFSLRHRIADCVTHVGICMSTGIWVCTLHWVIYDLFMRIYLT